MLKEKILKGVDYFIKPPVTGVDISDQAIKYLKFTAHKEKIWTDFWGTISIPEGIIVNGEIKNEEDLVKILKSWFNKEKKHLRPSLLSVSLPEEKGFLRLIQLPRVKREDIGKAIRWEIETNIPLPAEELIYDSEVIEPLEDSLNHLDLVITAFPKTIVDSYLRVFKKAGLKPAALELESQAIVRTTLADLRDKQAKIIVDLGRNRTSMIIFSGGAIIFTSTFEVGGRLLEENIAKTLKVDNEKAAALKKEVGLSKKEEDREVFNAILPAVAVIADELKKTIAYYQHHTEHSHGANKDIGEILLVGGDANLFGLETYLSSTLKIPSKLADPFAAVQKRLKCVVPPIPKNKALEFTTALGLALRGKVL